MTIKMQTQYTSICVACLQRSSPTSSFKDICQPNQPLVVGTCSKYIMCIDVNIGAHQQPLKLRMYPPLRPEEQVYGGEEEEDGDTGTHPIIITARNKLERWRPETFAHWPIIIFKFHGWLGVAGDTCYQLGVAGDTCHHQLGG